jgi:GNAT superfamily N-acetyltransferase
MSLTIRPATRDDVPMLRSLADAAITDLQRGYLDAAQIESSRAIMGIDSQLIADGRDAALLDPSTEPARIRGMYTHPAHAGRGVGRLILARCEEAAAADGFSDFELISTLSGRALYEAVGYRAVDKLEDGSGGAAVPLIRMRKSILGAPDAATE